MKPPFEFADGVLCAESVPLETIARRYGSPCYVYSRAALEQGFRAFASACKGRDVLLCYAMKANSNLAILDLFSRLGAGFDIVSGGELQRVKAAGGNPGKVVFSGVGKTRAEMRTALEAGELACGFVEGMGFGLGFARVNKPTGVTAMLSAGTFGHGGAFGTQGWLDPHQDLFVILLIQRSNLPNADASSLRQVLQEIAVKAIRR